MTSTGVSVDTVTTLITVVGASFKQVPSFQVLIVIMPRGVAA